MFESRWRHTTIVAAGIVLGLTTTTWAQALNEEFLRSTVLVSFDKAPDVQSFGTGFFVFRPTSGNQGHVLLVTNKHVLPPAGTLRSITIRVSTGPADNPSIHLVEVPVVGTDGKYLSNVRLHPNPDFDVAAVNVTETILKEKIKAIWLPLDLFSTPERLKTEGITIGDEIFLLGFPDSIYEPRNASPILRAGVIATNPLEGYAFNDALKKKFGLPDKIDGFLIDANVFPGSSGSVVILKQQVATIGPHGETKLGPAKKVPYVLGIVSGSIPITDNALGSTQRMGLGIVYSAEAIRTLIALFPK